MIDRHPLESVVRQAALIVINLSCLLISWQARTIETLLAAEAAALLSVGFLLKQKAALSPSTGSPASLTNDRETSLRLSMSGVLTLVLLLVGTGLVVALTGSTDLAEVRQTLIENYRPDRVDLLAGRGSLLGIAATVCFIVGCGIQFGLFPLHFFATDLFENEAAWQSVFTTISLRAQALIILLQVPFGALVGFESAAQLTGLLFAAGSVLAGAVLICRAESLRMIAAHGWLLWGGLILAGPVIGTTQPALIDFESGRQLPTDFGVAVFCLAIGAASLTGLLTMDRVLELTDRRIEFLDDLTGLGRSSKPAATVLACCLLTLCAIPPLPGFWCLTFLIARAFVPGTESSEAALLVPGVLVILFLAATVLSLLILSARIVKLLSLIYLHDPIRRPDTTSRRFELLFGGGVATTLFLIGFFPSRLLEFCNDHCVPHVLQAHQQSDSAETASSRR